MADDIISRALAKIRGSQASTPVEPVDALQPVGTEVPLMPPADMMESTPAEMPAPPVAEQQIPNVPIQITPVVAPPQQAATPQPAPTLAQPQMRAELPVGPVGPSPLKPQKAAAAPVPLPPIEIPEEALVEVEPTPEQQAKAIEQAVRPIQQVKAEQKAIDEVSAQEQALQNRAQSLQQDIESSYNNLDQQVRLKSLPELMSGSWGEKLGAALAVAMGGVAQGLLGTKSNAVIDFLDSMAQQQAQRDKLSLEQKEMLKKMLYEQAQTEIARKEAQTNSDYRKQMLSIERAKLGQQQMEVEQKLRATLAQQQAALGKFSGKALTPEQEAGLSLEERRLIVYLPDGRKVLANSYEDANKFKETLKPILDGLNSVNQLKKIGEMSIVDRSRPSVRERANSLVMKLTGALRLPYTGPGVLTDDERNRLIGIIGNPTAFMSLNFIELAKLDQLKRDLESNLQNEATTRGIKERVTPEIYRRVVDANGIMRARPESELIQEIKMARPNLTDAQIQAAIKTVYPEL